MRGGQRDLTVDVEGEGRAGGIAVDVEGEGRTRGPRCAR